MTGKRLKDCSTNLTVSSALNDHAQEVEAMQENRLYQKKIEDMIKTVVPSGMRDHFIIGTIPSIARTGVEL